MASSLLDHIKGFLMIKVMKIKNEDEIICDIVRINPHTYDIKNPLIINLYYDEGYIIKVEKYLKHIRYNDKIEIHKNDILCSYEPSPELVKYYITNIEKVKFSDNNVGMLLSSLANDQDETYEVVNETFH
jgi:hypothetical protein